MQSNSRHLNKVLTYNNNSFGKLVIIIRQTARRRLLAGSLRYQPSLLTPPSLPHSPFHAGEQLKGATARRVHEMELKRHLVIN